MGMSIRPIQESDLKACARLYAEVFSSAPWNEAWSEELAFERLIHFYHSKGFVGVLAKSEEVTNSVSGFVLGNTEPFYYGTLFYLREMCTKPNQQNKGVGAKLLSALETGLHDQEVKSIYLATEREIPAASFYQKHEFKLSEEMGFYAKRIEMKE